MRSFALLSRPRALLSALLLVAVAVGAVVGTAPPAGAQAKDPGLERAEVPARPIPNFQAILAALERLRAQALEPRPPADESCVEAGDSNDVPRVVADIFLCRLAEAGVDEPEARRIAVEAVVVSHCESKWDPNVVVFDGRYAETPHPRTGSRYTAAGIFQFIRKTADTWIDGGYARVKDPRRNIDAAARLYIRNRARGLGGWGDWACAAANDGFKRGSVLPGWPGGPADLPSWASEYVA